MDNANNGAKTMTTHAHLADTAKIARALDWTVSSQPTSDEHGQIVIRIARIEGAPVNRGYVTRARKPGTRTVERFRIGVLDFATIGEAVDYALTGNL